MLEAFPIIGGGPAGAAAALAMARAGAHPLIYEKSSFPRHKVCGEFLSPEILPVLEQIGVAEGFLALRPFRVSHAELHFGDRRRRFRLSEPAYGLSRYAFDDFLLRAAVERGAEFRREQPGPPQGHAISAAGRSVVSTRGRRIFGFKAHFFGTSNDAVELYFFPGGYCGLCPIENGATNVCGLVKENLLSARGFNIDLLLRAVPRMQERLAPLARTTRWYFTGPLRFGWAPDAPDLWLTAGDAACFPDPFTGSGLLAAVQTGVWAGMTVLRAAQGARWDRCRAWHRRRCSSLFRRQLTATTIIRRVLELGWAESLTAVLPGSLLFRLTRPGV